MNAGAKAIQFNQPVWGYVENFLNVPVGVLVPNGYYDRDRAVWVPSQNGLVLKILGVTNGLAQVDLTGSNVIADATALAAAAFTTAELQRIASTYSPGQSLWRVPLSHFSAWDWNWALGISPPKSPNTPGDKPKGDPCDTCPPKYGEVNFTTQVFQEAIPLVGVPMTLNYSSARVPDYRLEAKAVVPVLYFPPPIHVLGVQAQYEVAGKYTEQELGVVETAAVSWDGYDGYGRYLGGTRKARGDIVLELDPFYAIWRLIDLPSFFIGEPLFTSFGQTSFAAGHGGGRGLSFGATFTRLLTIPDHRTIGLGGWSLTPHHSYDPAGHFLYLGNGRVLKQDRFANGIGPVPGLSAVPNLSIPLKVAAGPDGTVYFQAYFTDSYSPRFFKLGADGQFAFLSGNSYTPGVVSVDAPGGYTPLEGKSALLAAINVVGDMTVGPDDSLYFREQYGSIGRIDPQGNLHLVLGDGPRVYPPDGSLARGAYSQATDGQGHIAVSRDGTVYYDDWWNTGCTAGDYSCGTNFIRRVAPDGRIYTVAGQAGSLWGDNFFDSTNGWRGQMGRKASEAMLTEIQSMAVAPDGTLYVSPIAQGQYGVGGIYKITPDGILGMVMNVVPFPNVGWEPYGPGDEGTNAATFASYYGGNPGPNSLQVAPDGSLAFHQSYGNAGSSIWRITPDGILQRLAGRGPYEIVSVPSPLSLQGVNPLQATLPFGQVETFAVGPDSSLTLGGSVTSPSAYRISASASGFSAQELQIPAEDASEIYVFDEHGLHLRTLNGLTGATNWSFVYNANNLVTDLRAANGLLTHIERDGAGQPTAIVGPYGQRTALALDANGFLNAVVNPVGEATLLTNTKGGLMTSITGPLGDTYTVAYDTNGLGTQVRDPLGGGYDETRSDQGTRIDIASSTTLANVDSRTLALLPSGDTYVIASYPDGSGAATTLTRGNGEWVTNSDGTIGFYASGGDPRFPTQASLPIVTEVKLPGGPEADLTFPRAAALADLNNPFSVVRLTNSMYLNRQLWTTTYDGTSHVWLAISPEGRQTVTGLDTQARVIHQQTPGQTPLDLTYDAQGRVSEIDDTASIGTRRTTLNYDSLGRVRFLTGPLGRTNRFSYDGAGRLQQLTLADGQVANFQSDAESHLTSVTPLGRPAHRFAYNAVGLVTNYVPPVVNGLDESVHYAYDADQNLTQVSLPDAQNVLFTRGRGGRIDQLVLGSGPTLTYFYGISISYDGYALGWRTNYTPSPINIVSSTGDSLHFDYQGAFTTTNTWSGSITGSVSLTLNTNFLPASQSVNGAAIAYTYDRDLLVTQAGNLTVNRDPVTGLITGTSLGSVTDQRQFDDRGLLTNYVASVSGTSVWSATYRYDLIGRLTDKVETVEGTTTTFGYVYDVTGRLQQVWQNGALATTYTYDANGNRLTRNTETAAYDAQDRVTSYNGAALAWSPNGTLQTHSAGGQTTTYTYDARGGLTGVSLPGGQQIAYVLDPVGHRIGKRVGGALQRGWLWSRVVPVAELGTNSEVTAQFVFASRPNVPDYLIKGADTFRIFTDERGSVRLVVKVADGTVAQQMDYDEFGRVLTDTHPGFQPFGFAGGLYDPDTGLVRFGVRNFDSRTGQWTSRDPLGFRGGSLSLYAYVNNDPLNYLDPLGVGPQSTTAYNAGSSLLGLAGSLATVVVAVALLPEELTLATAGAVGFLGFHIINSAWGVIANGFNLFAEAHGQDVLLGTSIPGIIAMGAGNSPDAQRLAAGTDLVIGLTSPSPGGRFGNAATTTSVSLGNAARANNAASAATASVSVGNAYGLTPGSKPPGCP